MMSSPHDGEALAAARKASSVLKQMDKRWTDLIDDKPVAAPAVTPKSDTSHTNQRHGFGFSGMGAAGQQYNPYAAAQQYNPFNQQNQYQQNAWSQEQLRQQQAFQEAAMRAEYQRSHAASDIDQSLKEKEEKKRKTFWSRLGS